MNVNIAYQSKSVSRCSLEGKVVLVMGDDGSGPGSAAHTASRSAAVTVTRGLGKELGLNGQVNALWCCKADTDFHGILVKGDVRSKVAASIPLKREGDPQEIEEIVTFLATNDAGFINGACIDVNGVLRPHRVAHSHQTWAI